MFPNEVRVDWKNASFEAYKNGVTYHIIRQLAPKKRVIKNAI